MANTVTIDLRHLARGLEFPLRQVQSVVELLDEGNTVPFITRYRKDQTGGLDEEQIREIQDRLAKTRLLAERKQTILRSIEAQGKLTEKLEKQILGAATTKRLEDLYLPFKPKKQTLATLARSRGLEELATEILEAAPAALDLDARARDFVSTDRQVPSGADALLGAGHILAEQFSERADLRQRLREIMQKSGKIVTAQIVSEAPAAAPAEVAAAEAPAAPVEDASQPPAADDSSMPEAMPSPAEPIAAPVSEAPTEPMTPIAEQVPSAASTEIHEGPPAAVHVADVVVEKTPVPDNIASASAAADDSALAVPAASAEGEGASGGESETPPDAAPVATESASGEAVAADAPPPLAAATARRARDRERAKAQKQAKKEAKKRKVDERRIKAFRDYFDYAEDIKRIPPHRVLAINRAERAKVLRVKIECDLEAVGAALEEILVPPGHPHTDFLRGAARDALTRLVLPALEREARRELTDRAETHAVSVFARNLRNLLLQPPVHNHRVLAVDPGFKSGCKLAAMDQFGNLLGHDVIMLVGNKPERKEEAKQKALALIRPHELTVVAIGNGTACRETEEFFAELLAAELKDQGVAYVIVNEAGASVYSTSQLGREEFPEYDATLRGAVSIGRRLLDPLSELVKIEPANIGVGLYQHDVKAKHLETSLDEVVESCVNYVGVDVNTASPALLRYVSGLNQLTARRVYEYRREHGPFRNREQLRAVAGFGDATFVQAAGFLKIASGDNPLDATWIHPESYEVAGKVLEQFSGKTADLADKEAAAALALRMAAVKLDELAKNLAASGVKIAADRPAQSMEASPAEPRDTACETPAAAATVSFNPESTVTATVSEVSDSSGAVADSASPPPALAVTRAVPRDSSVGTLTLQDILAQLARPGRDPREDLPPPVFKHGILKLEDLSPGMELTGTVLNVVDFGCFVDIGMHDSGLVHVSRLADRFIRDPHEVVAVGATVHVWVMEVDKERRRVSLTMVRPGSERQRRPPRGESGDAEQGTPRAGGSSGRGAGRRGDRPPRSGQDRGGGRPQGDPQTGTPAAAQGQAQGDRSQGGRPQGGRFDRGRRPPPAGGGQPSPGGPPREDRRGHGGPPPRRPRPQGGGHSGSREFKPKPGPITPISDDMKKGKEPMRTFGDLMQFFDTKTDDKKPPKKDKKEGAKPPAASPSGESPPPEYKPEAQASGSAEYKPEAQASGSAEYKPEAQASGSAEYKPEAQASGSAEYKPEAQASGSAEYKPEAQASGTDSPPDVSATSSGRAEESPPTVESGGPVTPNENG